MKEQQQIIDNFLTTMDISLEIVHHYRNAMRDAIAYKWPTGTLISIMAGIEEAYNNKY